MIPSVRARGEKRWQLPARFAALDLFNSPPRWLVTHVFPTVVAMLVSLRWYESGTFIAAGDVTPFVRNSISAELTSLWNHQITGAGSTSTEIVRLHEVLLIRLVTTLGGSEILAQQLFFTLGFGFAAFGAAHVARVLVRSPGAIAVAGLIGAFNPLILTQLPNPLFMITIGAVGLMLGELMGHLVGRPTSVVRLVVASLPCAYLATNPALLALTSVSYAAAVVVASRFVPNGRISSLGKVIISSLPWVFALHLWWLIPSVYVMGIGLEGADLGLVTNVDQWAWSHAENSLPNLVTLTAHWGWNIDFIFPWVSEVDGFPGSLTRWILPVGALLAPLVARRSVRKVAWGLVGLVVVAVVLSKGLHEPAPWANRWLYENVPGFWLLREPVSKIGPLQVLLYAVLFALSVERLIGMAPVAVGRLKELLLPGRDMRSAAPLGQILAGFMVIGAVAFPWPLLSGSVIADERGPLQSIHTGIPDEWFEIADAINESAVEGKVLVLPSNDFYQVTTTWGYHGADAVPQQLLERPMIQRYPGGYFDLSPGFGATLDRIEREIVDGSPEVAAQLISSLGVSHVIHRYDVVSGAVNAQLADNDLLAAGLSQTPGLVKTSEHDVAVIYEVGQSDGVVTVDTRTIATRGDPNDVAEAVGRLVPGEVIVGDARTADALAWMSESTADIFPFDVEESASYEVLSAPGPRTVFASAQPLVLGPGRTDWTVSIADRSQVALDGDMLPSAAADEIVLPSEPLAISVGGSLDVFEQDLGVTVDLAESITVFNAASQGNFTGFETLGDCNNRAPQINETLVLSAVRTAGNAVRLGANDHSACVSTDLPTQSGPSLVEFEYRTGDEDSGRVCIWDVTGQECVHDERLEHSPEWTQVRAAADLDAAHDYQVFVYAVSDDGRSVLVEYRDLDFLPLSPNEMNLTPELPTTVLLQPGPHLLTTTQPTPASKLGAFGDLDDCHRFDEKSISEAGLSLVKTASSVSLTANTHSACSRAELDVVSGRQYELSFDYRTVQGSAARFCLWMVGLDRCAELPGLDVADGWRQYHSEFVLPTAASGADLFLYADGGDTPDTTEVDFRDLAVAPSPQRYVQVERQGVEPRVAPAIDWIQNSPGDFDLIVSEAAGPFVLTFNESDSARWSLSGLPDAWSARRVSANGYANAWIVEGEGQAVLSLEFGPNGVANRAQNVSLVAALLALIGLGWRFGERSKDRRAAALGSTGEFGNGKRSRTRRNPRRVKKSVTNQA